LGIPVLWPLQGIVLKNQNSVVLRPAQSAVGKARLRKSDSQDRVGTLSHPASKQNPTTLEWFVQG